MQRFRYIWSIPVTDESVSEHCVRSTPKLPSVTPKQKQKNKHHYKVIFQGRPLKSISFIAILSDPFLCSMYLYKNKIHYDI